MLVRMLGPFEVDGADGPVVVAGASQRTVLALLALHAGRPVGVSTLVDALWPDGPPASARNSLQSHVARLRSALGVPGLIPFGPAGYRLAVPRAAVDVLCFEDLLRADRTVADALDLWRGPPLPEFPGEPFRGVAARLTTQHRDALARRVTTMLAAPAPTRQAGSVGSSAAGFAEAVERLHAAASADACWERGATTLAVALTTTGRRGEAVEVLRRHADAVVDTLGLDPSAAVRRLQASVLRGELDPGSSPAAAQRPGPPTRLAGAPGDRPTPVSDGSGHRSVAGASPRSLPLRFSSFLGRDEEQQFLADLLAMPCLITVAGPGGVGKTRLVAETVRATDRVAWVDAADVTADDFLAAVAVGVGARIGPLEDPLPAIARQAARHTVVVLDNCEHVVEPAAALVEAMLGVRVVITSQERLRVDGERVLHLGPLPVQAAARLFRERSGLDAPEVDEIVRRLDCLPLAVELAATQAAALGVPALRDRLDDRLDLLVRGRRTGDARHRTLRAVVDWSFALLDDELRTVLRRLSVFAGGFDVAQAEAVVADAAVARSRVAAMLAALVDRSLVVRHGPGRFRLLETVRAYAAERRDGDREATEQRHAAAMLAAARDLDRRLRGPEQADAVRRIDALLPDLRLAYARGDTGVRTALAAAMYRYGYRCQQYEVLAWGRAAIGQPAAADALAAAASHAWGRGDLAEARSLAGQAGPPGAPAHEVLGDVALVSGEPETALAHYRAMDGEPAYRISGLVGEALVLAYVGRTAEAVEVAGTAVQLADATGSPGARAEARYGLGEALGDSEPARALELLTEAAELAAGVDDRLFRGAAETAAVAIRSRHGDPAAALTAFRDVLGLWRRVGNDTLQTAALRNLVVLLARVGADETAVLVDAALPPAAVYPAEAARLDRARAAAAERLGAERVAALRRRGATLTTAAVHDEASRAIDAALSRLAG